MSVVKINVLTVPAEQRAELERRFSGRAGMVESADGFEWFELLRPQEGTDRYLVYTRWRSEEDFKRWTDSQAFQRGHARASADAGAQNHGQETGQGHGQEHGQGHGHGQEAGQGHGHGHGQGPAATGATLWSFEVVQSTGPKDES
ncbi:antibiotic biosynthesis monooxygenase family protein [Streptosporangium sp. CA-135522]|uniref:antibiotic biosynthesis monooxygenase family protein n=1 Tax=Streptosporangium sp. CA-135522 TaxID=3240072 RepID=UPI003D8F1D11